MHRCSLPLTLVLLCIVIPFATAQTQTIPNPDGGGGSVVQVITTDVNGLSVTNTFPLPAAGGIGGAGGAGKGGAAGQNPGAATTTIPTIPTTTLATTTTPGNLGPVQQPPPTTPVGQGITTYQYTTVDAFGQTTVIQDTFTPTYNTPSPQSSPASGTILSPSDFSALIGTHTAGGPTGGARSWRIMHIGARSLVLIWGVIVGVLTVL